VRRGVIRSSAKLANARGERREQGCARPSMSHCATCEGMPARLSKSAQRHFTDCLAALGQCVGLLQVFDADRAEPTRPWTRTLVDYLRPGAGASLPRGCFASALIRFHRRPRCAARRRRTATRGHSATEGGDERVGVKRALSVRAPASRTDSMGNFTGSRLFHTTTPAANDATRDRTSRTARGDWMCVSRAAASAARQRRAAHRRARRSARSQRDGRWRCEGRQSGEHSLFAHQLANRR